MIYLILFSSFFLTANAKTINRQAYKVCKTNEEAYWNGSSAQCCDTKSSDYILVKNYTNGIGENGYACCAISKDKYSSSDFQDGSVIVTTVSTATGYTIDGAVNGTCCGGYTTSDMTVSRSDGSSHTQQYNQYSSQILQNGGVYYCANSWTEGWKDFNHPNNNYESGYFYESPNRWCAHSNGKISHCACSEKGDPRNGADC